MSTLAVLRGLFEGQIAVEATTSSSDPSSTLLNKYLNESVKKISRRDSPIELMNATPASIDITSGVNTATFPSTLLNIKSLYYKQNGGKFKRLYPLALDTIIDRVGANNFFDTSFTGDPTYFDVKGSSLVFDKYFNRSEVGAIKAYGISNPTTMTTDASACSLSTAYDFLTVYESCVLFYQRDDDLQNMQKYQLLADTERRELINARDNNYMDEVVLDPRSFGSSGGGINYPGVFFGS